MTRTAAILLAALACAVATVLLVLSSDSLDGRAVWAVFGPAVGLSFIGTGLYAERRRPESRTGTLMVVLGFAWFVYALDAANDALPYTASQVLGGLWGGAFLHLGLTFPTGRARSVRSSRAAAKRAVSTPLRNRWTPSPRSRVTPRCRDGPPVKTTSASDSARRWRRPGRSVGPATCPAPISPISHGRP